MSAVVVYINESEASIVTYPELSGMIYVDVSLTISFFHRFIGSMLFLHVHGGFTTGLAVGAGVSSVTWLVTVPAPRSFSSPRRRPHLPLRALWSYMLCRVAYLTSHTDAFSSFSALLWVLAAAPSPFLPGPF